MSLVEFWGFSVFAGPYALYALNKLFHRGILSSTIGGRRDGVCWTVAHVVSDQKQGYHVEEQDFASDTLEYIIFSGDKARHRRVYDRLRALKVVRST